MIKATVGRWRNSLAIRVPHDVADALGLRKGEQVEVKIQGDDILVCRAATHFLARITTANAAAEIIAECKMHSLKGVSLEDLHHRGQRE